MVHSFPRTDCRGRCPSSNEEPCHCHSRPHQPGTLLSDVTVHLVLRPYSRPKIKIIEANQTTTTTTYQIAVIEVSTPTKLCVGVIPEIRVRILSITTILKIILNNKTKDKLIPYDEICILSGT